MTKLLNKEVNTKFIWQYEGSLTTPPCTEGVAWNVVAQPLNISDRQLRLLRLFTARGKKLATNTANPYNIGGNNRAVQPLNDRLLYVFGEETQLEADVPRMSKGLYDYR